MALTKEQSEKIKQLSADAFASKVLGYEPVVDDGSRYALLSAPDGYIVTDGERFWEHPALVHEFDVHKDFTTQRYYLRGVKKVGINDDLPNTMFVLADQDELKVYFTVAETVIFDHTRQDANGRSVRTVIRHRDGKERSSEKRREK